MLDVVVGTCPLDNNVGGMEDDCGCDADGEVGGDKTNDPSSSC